MKLDSKATQSLTEMLKITVTELEFNAVENLDISLLDSYDGQGRVNHSSILKQMVTWFLDQNMGGESGDQLWVRVVVRWLGSPKYQ